MGGLGVWGPSPASQQSPFFYIGGPSGGDDGPLIQRKLDAAFNVGGGTVLLAPGVYNLLTRLTLNDNVALVGGGARGGVILRCNTQAQAIVNSRWQGALGAGTNKSLRLENLKLDLNGSAANPSSYPQFTNVSGLRVERCDIINPWGFGFILNYGTANAVTANDNCDIIDCTFDGTTQTQSADLAEFNMTTNLRLERCTFTNGTSSTNCSISLNTNVAVDKCVSSGCANGTGFSIEACNHVSLTDCKAYSCNWGIEVEPWELPGLNQPSQEVSILGCDAFQNTLNGIILHNITGAAQTNGAQGVTVLGCKIYRNGRSGILIYGVRDFVVALNIIRQNSTAGAGTYYAVEMQNFGTPGSPINTGGKIALNDISDSQGTPTQTSIVRLAQYDVIDISSNIIQNATTVVSIDGTGPNGQYTERGNTGRNPLGGAVTGTPTATPVSTTHYRNTTGSDLLVSLTGGTVSNVTVYDTGNANGVTVATATGCIFVLPAGAYYATTWTVQPTAAFYGL